MLDSVQTHNKKTVPTAQRASNLFVSLDHYTHFINNTAQNVKPLLTLVSTYPCHPTRLPDPGPLAVLGETQSAVDVALKSLGKTRSDPSRRLRKDIDCTALSAHHSLVGQKAGDHTGNLNIGIS